MKTIKATSSLQSIPLLAVPRNHLTRRAVPRLRIVPAHGTIHPDEERLSIYSQQVIRQTDIWETVVFGALGLSGFLAVTVLLLAS